MHTPDFRPPL